MTNTDNAAPAVVLAQLVLCADHWVPEARIIGDIRAADISRAVRALLAEPAVIPALAWEDRGDRESVVRSRSLSYRVARVSAGEEKGQWVAMNGQWYVSNDCFPAREMAKEVIEEHFRLDMAEMLSPDREDD
jgi:phage/plasmid primase-like uncharacterized protein